MWTTWAFLIAAGVIVVALVVAAAPTIVRVIRGTVWYVRGLRAYRRQDLDRALRAWTRTIEIVPWHPSAHYNLGVLHGKAGRTDEAIQEYERAIELNSRLGKAHFNLGNAYMAKEEYRRAAQAYEAASHTRRCQLRSHLNLGILYQQHLLEDRKALYLPWPSSYASCSIRIFSQRVPGYSRSRS